MNPLPTRILTRRDVAALMTPADYRTAVSHAFAALAQGRGACPPPMHIAAPEGGFHVKGASFTAGELTPGGPARVAIKVNGNFPANPARHGLPTIQGAVLLFDGETGQVLAVIDSIEVTLQRTAAASAVAAQHLARPASAVITVCGCGEQSLAQLRALQDVLPLTSGFAWDRDPERARVLASRAQTLGVAMTVTEDLARAARRSDVIVTCTTSPKPFLEVDHVPPGTFIAAVGADSPVKSEIAPDLMARAMVVTDVTEQCLAMGDLRHAVAAGAMAAADVHAELGDLVGGRRPGRGRDEDVTLFDSTGAAVQDAASAAVIYARACAAGAGLGIELGAI